MAGSARSASSRPSLLLRMEACGCCARVASRPQIRSVVGELLVGAATASPRVPGSAPMHYAPRTPLTVVPAGEIDAQAEAASADGRRVAVLAQRLPLRSHKWVTWINAGRRPETYGRDLYTNLRTLDK